MTADDLAAEMAAAIEANPELDDDGLDALVSKLLPPPKPSAAQDYQGIVHSVTVQGVRSFGPAQTLRLSGGLTIVYAANGTGKTSLVDALELFTHGVTTRAEAHPDTAGEVKDQHHVPHHDLSGKADRDVPPEVSIAWKPTQDDELRTAAWVDDFGRGVAGGPDIQVLPRRRIRELVHAKTSERAARLGPALGLSDFGQLCTDVAKLLRDRADTDDDAGDKWQSAALLLERDVSGSADREMLRREVESWAETHRVTNQDSATVALVPPPNLPASQAWKDLTDDIGEHERKRPQTSEAMSDELRHLLRAFADVAGADETCPACESGSVSQERIDEVQRLLSGRDELSKYDARSRNLAERYGQLRNSLEASDLRWHFELPPASADDPYASLREIHGRWQQAWHAVVQARDALGAEPDRRLIGDVEAALRSLEGVMDDAEQTYRDVIDARTVPSDDDGRGVREAVRLIDTDSERVTTCLETVRASRRVNADTKNMAARVTSHRRSVLEEALADLSRPINGWLRILAPTNTPSVDLTPRGTSGAPGVNLQVRDREKSLHALGHFSDSQIDMLGLATHLARIERDHPGALVVIDDPSDMLDSYTRKKFAQQGIDRLLGNDVADSAHQVVVLTHDDALVRDLWEHHRDRTPCTVQDTIEVCVDDDDAHALLESRTAKTALNRARILIEEHSHNRDRLWVRSAVAGHARTAVEMYAKDLATLLGPAGADRLCSIDENSDLRTVAGRVSKELRSIEDSWCDHGRHVPGRNAFGKARDLLAGWVGETLNPGSHADVVLPEVSECKDVLTRLERLIADLEPPEGALRSEWTTKCEMAKRLATCDNCESSR